MWRGGKGSRGGGEQEVGDSQRLVTESSQETCHRSTEIILGIGGFGTNDRERKKLNI